MYESQLYLMQTTHDNALSVPYVGTSLIYSGKLKVQRRNSVRDIGLSVTPILSVLAIHYSDGLESSWNKDK